MLRMVSIITCTLFLVVSLLNGIPGEAYAHESDYATLATPVAQLFRISKDGHTLQSISSKRHNRTQLLISHIMMTTAFALSLKLFLMLGLDSIPAFIYSSVTVSLLMKSQ
ncbi:MAG: hypothetical protein JW938_05900 [Candidatus Omnitrophica bacterium]|nr:hypothetical protein [Candidatus Omnitrophota bacterium]